MTRYVVIALMNLLVVASIAGNALIALFRGCNIDGTCSSGSGVLTWALGVGLGFAVLICGALLVRYARKHHRVTTTHRISIASLPKFARASAVDDEVEAADEIDEAMLSRLARMTRASADIAETPEDGTVSLEIVETFATIAPPALDERVNAMSAAKPSADLHLVVRDGERTEWRPQTPVEINEPLDWLFDTASATNAAQIRRDIGFPWCVAGIDHVCLGIVQFGPTLKDTDILPEASAWRSVTADLPRNSRLADDDAIAFTEWLNVGLRLVGRNGRAMIVAAVQRLETEALVDSAISNCLPKQLHVDDNAEFGPRVRFG